MNETNELLNMVGSAYERARDVAYKMSDPDDTQFLKEVARKLYHLELEICSRFRLEQRR